MNCLCSYCYIVMFILCVLVSSSHFARNIFLYGPPVTITDIVNCLQHFCKYFIRISQCYFTLYVLIYNTWSHHAMKAIVYLCSIIIMTLVNYLMTGRKYWWRGGYKRHKTFIVSYCYRFWKYQISCGQFKYYEFELPKH